LSRYQLRAALLVASFFPAHRGCRDCRRSQNEADGSPGAALFDLDDALPADANLARQVLLVEAKLNPALRDDPRSTGVRIRMLPPKCHAFDDIVVTSAIGDMRRHDWIIYAKPAFGGPMQVLKYLGRYAHRVDKLQSSLVGLREGALRVEFLDYAPDAGTRYAVTIGRQTFARKHLCRKPASLQH
jgi:hypothetical protein